MNKKLFINKLLILLILISMCLVSCRTNNESQEPKPVEPIENEKYTIAFFNNNQLVYSIEAKAGDFIDLPDESLLFSDPRYIFVGWEGIDDADFAAGKVEVFCQNAFYHAKWEERFGTDKIYSITKVPSSKNIVVDGILDEAYLTTEEISVNTVTAGDTDTNATLYFMFDENNFYLFADVKDSTVFTRDYNSTEEQWIEHNDAIEFWIDLLHNDSKQTPNWTGVWGGDYRGEPGPMCEAHFKINAGYDPKIHGRFGAGSEAVWDGWWSNACNDDGVSFGISKITDEGYTVEYMISLSDTNIPDYLRMNVGQEIGIGVKIYDKRESGGNKNVPASNIITLEAINHDMSGPKKLSNFIVKETED